MPRTYIQPKSETAILGGGCFWCLEAVYQLVEGVTAGTSGYAGGHMPDPSYEQVSSGATGHAEVVKVDFDPSIITYADLLDIFWAIHDPTTKDRQGHDEGSQYRSIILYLNDSQKDLAQASKAAVAKLWPDPIVTEIASLKQFYEAEASHQNYYNNNSGQGYCQVIINPKLAKLREKFANRLKRKDTA